MFSYCVSNRAEENDDDDHGFKIKELLTIIMTMLLSMCVCDLYIMEHIILCRYIGVDFNSTSSPSKATSIRYYTVRTYNIQYLIIILSSVNALSWKTKAFQDVYRTSKHTYIVWHLKWITKLMHKLCSVW